MHRVFQTFIDGLAVSGDAESLRRVLSDAAAALDLTCFAYLSLPSRKGDAPKLISTYPIAWTDHYLRERYERLDPVIAGALATPEPFEWGQDFNWRCLSESQCSFLDEAACFGIRYGFTVPIHDPRGPVAAITFATDERRTKFQHCIEQHRHVLQLMAMYFHARARWALSINRTIDGVALTPREFECLQWAARGKSAWDIGCILNVQRRAAAFHLENAKAKLGVHSICQAVARLAATSRPPQ